MTPTELALRDRLSAVFDRLDEVVAEARVIIDELEDDEPTREPTDDAG